jgi:hypothetical protein
MKIRIRLFHSQHGNIGREVCVAGASQSIGAMAPGQLKTNYLTSSMDTSVGASSAGNGYRR